MNAEIMDLKLIIIDVDGTLTDSGIYYDSSGKETKKFSTRDAAAFFVLKELGIKTMILTGRSSVATEKRVKELNVDYFFQNIKDKHTFLMKFMNEKELTISEIGYIGDDLNDLLAIKTSKFNDEVIDRMVRKYRKNYQIDNDLKTSEFGINGILDIKMKNAEMLGVKIAYNKTLND